MKKKGDSLFPVLTSKAGKMGKEGLTLKTRLYTIKFMADAHGNAELNFLRALPRINRTVI